MEKCADTSLVILAAGMGSRYGGLKQLDDVGPSGETILDYSVYDAIEAGFTKVVFIIRRDFEDEFKKKVVSKFEDKIKVEIVFQDLNDLPDGFTVPEGRTKPWGTAHALISAKDAVNEPFCVINADDFYSRSAFLRAHEFLVSDELTNLHSSNYLQLAMLGFQLSNTLSDNGSVARGVCKTDAEDNLVKIEELLKIFKTDDGAENRDENANRKLSGQEPVSMNMWCLSPKIFEILEENFKPWLQENINVEKSEYLLPVEIDKLLQDGKVKVKVLHTDAKWFGVTYKEDKSVVIDSINELVKAGQYPGKLF